jgi:hypothetical protein
MKAPAIALAIATALTANGVTGEVKCQAPNGTWHLYGSRSCESGYRSGGDGRASTAGAALEVSDRVVRQCFEGYRKLSLDPTQAKFIGHSATIVPSGFPVLHVSAVFTNRYGGPDRRLLWCKLTNDLQIDEAVMKKKWTDFFVELHGR